MPVSQKNTYLQWVPNTRNGKGSPRTSDRLTAFSALWLTWIVIICELKQDLHNHKTDCFMH